MFADAVVPDLPYVVIDLSMLATELALLLALRPRRWEAPQQAMAVLVAAGLVGSAGALLAVFWAILHPDLNSLTIVFEALGISMGFPPGFWMIATIALRDARLPTRSLRWPLLFAGAATAGEVLMGVVFTAAASPSTDVGDLLVGALVSPWYLGSSAAVMGVLAAWLPLPADRRRQLWLLATAGASAPLIVWAPLEEAALMSILMIGSFVALAVDLSSAPAEAGRGSAWVRSVVAAYLAMALAGATVAAFGGTTLTWGAFGAVTSVVMFAELTYLLRAGVPDPSGEALPIPGAERAPEGTGGDRPPLPAGIERS